MNFSQDKDQKEYSILKNSLSPSYMLSCVPLPSANVLSLNPGTALNCHPLSIRREAKARTETRFSGNVFPDQS